MGDGDFEIIFTRTEKSPVLHFGFGSVRANADKTESENVFKRFPNNVRLNECLMIFISVVSSQCRIYTVLINIHNSIYGRTEWTNEEPLLTIAKWRHFITFHLMPDTYWCCWSSGIFFFSKKKKTTPNIMDTKHHFICSIFTFASVLWCCLIFSNGPNWTLMVNACSAKRFPFILDLFYFIFVAIGCHLLSFVLWQFTETLTDFSLASKIENIQTTHKFRSSFRECRNEHNETHGKWWKWRPAWERYH